MDACFAASAAARIVSSPAVPFWLFRHSATRFRGSSTKSPLSWGPGELIAVAVTEPAVAINPKRQDLLDAVKGKDLPIRPVEGIKTGLSGSAGKARETQAR